MNGLGGSLSERFAALMHTVLFTRGIDISENGLFEAILRSSIHAADCTAASLYLCDESTHEFRLIACFYNDRYYRIEDGAAVSGIASWVFKHKKPLVNRAENDADIPVGMYTFLYPAERIAAVPLCVEDTCLGVLEAAGKGADTDFSDEDMALLGITAGYAALLYRTVCMYRLHAGMLKYTDRRIAAGSDNAFCIAASPAMREKLDLCSKLADSEIPVLFAGENSVGKAFCASLLHSLSRRAAYPFIRVNCAEPQSALLEDRLFGTQEGSGTDGGNCFEQAAGGTLFFDEPAALPIHLQKKLAQALSEYETAGSPVRLVAATERNLEQLVHEGGFLSELYGKLNVLPVYIPPLRHRPEDVSAFAYFFLHRTARQLKKNFTGFSEDAEAALVNAVWQGNIRELQNTVEYGCLRGRPPFVTCADLFARDTDMDCGGVCGLKSAVDSFKRRYIRSVLEHNHWNQTAAAAAMGIQRTYLSRLIKELNIRINSN